VVYRDGGRIRFEEAFKAAGVEYFLEHVDQALAKGMTDLTFDFSKTTMAFPESMVPVLATADWLRANGCRVEVLLPREPELHRLFLNTSWAHYLDPKVYTASDVNIDHFNARRFQDAKQQQQVVNELMRLAVAKLKLTRDELTAMEWSINEITDNVLTHAESKAGGLVQVLSLSDFIVFCVADSGRGILKSMQEGYPHLRNDAQAIGEAVKAGVTRDPKVGQGNGLAGTLRIAATSGGRFSVASHRGRLSVAGAQANHSLRPHAAAFKGTMVTASIGISRNLKIDEALGFTGVHAEHTNILDYHDEEGETIVLRLAAETEGVGSRPAGAFIREKCQHLLRQEPGKPIVLDWSGVPVVSSSFADEALGKLFAELGPIVFGARIKHKAMEPVNMTLVNTAILQRAAQQAGTFGRQPGPAHAVATPGRGRRRRRRGGRGPQNGRR
jgi:anti-sigma regulatory factor (Ser/Thr protein kinase)